MHALTPAPPHPPPPALPAQRHTQPGHQRVPSSPRGTHAGCERPVCAPPSRPHAPAAAGWELPRRARRPLWARAGQRSAGGMGPRLPRGACPDPLRRAAAPRPQTGPPCGSRAASVVARRPRQPPAGSPGPKASHGARRCRPSCLAAVAGRPGGACGRRAASRRGRVACPPCWAGSPGPQPAPSHRPCRARMCPRTLGVRGGPPVPDSLSWIAPRHGGAGRPPAATTESNARPRLLPRTARPGRGSAPPARSGACGRANQGSSEVRGRGRVHVQAGSVEAVGACWWQLLSCGCHHCCVERVSRWLSAPLLLAPADSTARRPAPPACPCRCGCTSPQGQLVGFRAAALVGGHNARLLPRRA